MSERKQRLIEARQRIHERRKAAGAQEAAAQAERLKVLEDSAAAQGIELGPRDRVLLGLVALSPGAFGDIAGKCWQCGNPYDSAGDGCDACDA